MFIAARISYIHFFTAVHVYMIFIIIYSHNSSLGWFIWTQHIDQLPVGLLAQLVERCISIAEVMGSNTVRAKKVFSGLISATSSVMFIAARIFYNRFFTAAHIYDFHIFTIISPRVVLLNPINLDLRKLCINCNFICCLSDLAYRSYCINIHVTVSSFLF